MIFEVSVLTFHNTWLNCPNAYIHIRQPMVSNLSTEISHHVTFQTTEHCKVHKIHPGTVW